MPPEFDPNSVPAPEPNPSVDPAQAAPPADTNPAPPASTDPAPANPAQPTPPASTEGADVKRAPESYDFTPAEGEDPYDPEFIQSYGDIARKYDLTQEQAAGFVRDIGKAYQGITATKVMAVRDSWVASAKTDAEFGGDRYDQSVSAANAALSKVSTPEFVEYLKQTGLGDHPEMIRIFYRISKVVGEDGAPFGGEAAPGSKTVEDSFYPSMKK